MKKNKLLILIILLLTTFFIPLNANAETITCSDMIEAVNSYKEIQAELDSIDCSKVSDSQIVVKCNKYNTDKALVLSKIFKYNDELKDCGNSEIDKIISDNKNICKSVLGSSLKDLTKNIMTIFYVIAPFLLIIFGSLDFSKIVIGTDPETINKSKKNFKKRLIAFILLLLTPYIVSLILRFNLSEYSLNGNFYTCKTETRFQLTRWESTYVPSSGYVASGNVGVVGDWHTDWFQGDERWGDDPWGTDGTVRAGGCGSLATSIVASHYGGDSESSPYYPKNTAHEYYSKGIQPNETCDAIPTFFNEWHPELGLKATIGWGDIDLNELDRILANGGCMIADYTINESSDYYNGIHVWTSGGHYVTIFAGNQNTGYRVADSNKCHNDGCSGVTEWAPYGQHVFSKEFIEHSYYYYFIEKR